MDVTKNPELKVLQCAFLPINKLDISKNTKLVTLICESTQIGELDVSNNPNLTQLFCSNTQISELDVNNNTNLESLNCGSTKIAKLDVSKNTKLKYLDCWWTDITDLDVSKNTALETLWCSNTKITELDLTQNHNLKQVEYSAFAVDLQGEYSLTHANTNYFLRFADDETFSLKDQTPSLKLDRIKNMTIEGGATWNDKTGAIENIPDGDTLVSYTYTTNGTNKDTKEPIEAKIQFRIYKESEPAPTTQPTATPAPSAQPTATPAPTSAPVPTATPVPGTPGEITGDKADQLLKDPNNTQLANEIVTQINYERYMNVTSKVATAVANAIRYNPMNLGASKDGIQFGATLHKDNSGFVLVPESAAIEGDRAQVSLHFEDGKGNVVQPKLGGLVTVKIPGKTMPAGDYVLVGEGNRMIDSVTVTTVGNDTVISFWAPHFSTYAIVPRSAYVAPSDNNNGGGTAGNPIKATGLDMSMALMGVVAMAGVAVVGGAVVAKKSKEN